MLVRSTPKDFDLATDATPDEVLEITNGFKSNLQGKAFGVIIVRTIDGDFEIATFRSDIYESENDFLEFLKEKDINRYKLFLKMNMKNWKNIASEFFTEEYEEYKSLIYSNRNPKNVKFTTIDKDVLRRDLAFNALFYDLDKQEIIDLVGGVDDMKNHIARFVGEPTQRIIEDPLRILRILRFSERYGFKIEKNSGSAIIDNVEKLSKTELKRMIIQSGLLETKNNNQSNSI